jgi:hypothetical protein
VRPVGPGRHPGLSLGPSSVGGASPSSRKNRASRSVGRYGGEEGAAVTSSGDELPLRLLVVRNCDAYEPPVLRTKSILLAARERKRPGKNRPPPRRRLRQDSPGQSDTAQPWSAALGKQASKPTPSSNPQSTEKLPQSKRRIGLGVWFASRSIGLFRGTDLRACSDPGRRYALPWAIMLGPCGATRPDTIESAH